MEYLVDELFLIDGLYDALEVSLRLLKVEVSPRDALVAGARRDEEATRYLALHRLCLDGDLLELVVVLFRKDLAELKQFPHCLLQPRVVPVDSADGVGTHTVVLVQWLRALDYIK